jgi:molybdopterin/thiamine biosynthesis adenylyltransferase
MTAVQEVRPDALYHRQHGFYNPTEHKNDHVTFIGVGGIGSFAAFATGKLGVPKITLVDDDTVELHNAPNQMHPVILGAHEDALGEPKVDVTARMIHEHSGGLVEVCPVNAKHDGVAQYDGVVVSGLDSMAARQAVWDEKIKGNIAVSLYIDARISGQLILIYAAPNPYLPDVQAAYEKTLHSDDEAERVSCTEKGIIDVGFQCGALISRMIRRYFTGEPIHNCTYMSEKSLMLKEWDW